MAIMYDRNGEKFENDFGLKKWRMKWDARRRQEPSVPVRIVDKPVATVLDLAMIISDDMGVYKKLSEETLALQKSFQTAPTESKSVTPANSTKDNDTENWTRMTVSPKIPGLYKLRADSKVASRDWFAYWRGERRGEWRGICSDPDLAKKNSIFRAHPNILADCLGWILIARDEASVPKPPEMAPVDIPKDFTPWDGRGTPVLFAETMVSLIFRNGKRIDSPVRGALCSWRYSPITHSPRDIIAYKVVTE